MKAGSLSFGHPSPSNKNDVIANACGSPTLLLPGWLLDAYLAAEAMSDQN